MSLTYFQLSVFHIHTLCFLTVYQFLKHFHIHHLTSFPIVQFVPHFEIFCQQLLPCACSSSGSSKKLDLVTQSCAIQTHTVLSEMMPPRNSVFTK